ncbi:hypothetical protein [Halovivax limisalsi]|uniref:hypothetical protein n=1 Tax=Halovivax limisalsi TaxID=1453760 RepID=UPI001FFDACE8|nr:hypothetical protein [Halovivax limisalsi]
MAFDHERFLELEVEHDLYGLEADGVRIWERMRRKVATEIRQQAGIGEAHTQVQAGSRAYLKALWLASKNIAVKNPFLGDRSDVVFVGHPRRKQLEDGLWWDLYTDPIHDALEAEYLHLEFAYQLDHSVPVPTPRIRYMDLPKYGGEVLRHLGVRRPSLSPVISRTLRETQAAIEQQFDASVDLEAIAVEELHKRAIRLGPYKRIIERIDPELLVLAVSYDNEIVIEAAHERDVPVAELQHGVITEHHYGYHFPAPRTKRAFPDYLLTFGAFWNDAADVPLPDERILPVGYPYLELRKERYDDVASKKQLLFISQGTIGEQLSKFALAVAEHPDRDFEIVYKLHPGEYDRWQTDYPWLVDAPFDVVDSSAPPLYELFAQSSAQIGVGSTAIYEGLAFDLETFIYECPGADALDALVTDGVAERVSSAETLVDRIGRRSGSVRTSHIFAPDAVESMATTIENLRTSATCYHRN